MTTGIVLFIGIILFCAIELLAHYKAKRIVAQQLLTRQQSIARARLDGKTAYKHALIQVMKEYGHLSYEHLPLVEETYHLIAGHKEEPNTIHKLLP